MVLRRKAETGAKAKEYLLGASKIATDSLRVIKQAREEVRAAVDLLLDGVTVFLLPTTPCAPPPMNAGAEATATWRERCSSSRVSLALRAPRS